MFNKRSYKDVARGIVTSHEGRELITETLNREFGIKTVNYRIKAEGGQYLSTFRCDAYQWLYIQNELANRKIAYDVIERCF